MKLALIRLALTPRVVADNGRDRRRNG